MLTDRGFSHMLANIILEKDPTNEAALKMLQQPKNRAVVNGVTYDLDKVSEESVTEVWAEDVVSRLTPRAVDGGEVLPLHNHIYVDGYCACGHAVERHRN